MKNKIFTSLFVLLLLAGSSGTAYYYYDKYQEAKSMIDNPDMAAQTEVKQLTDNLGKLIVLPTDEEPTVATVLEKDKLTDQPFFSKSENGDKVIIYSKAMKAILYRPSENKIIEVAPIEITQPEEDQTNQEATSEPKVNLDEAEATEE